MNQNLPLPLDISAAAEEELSAELVSYENRDVLRFVTCGSVDDGKSTLIGRLLYDAQLVPEDQLMAIKKARQSNNSSIGLDLSLLTDGLLAEREQGITIDVAYRYFSTAKRKFIIADCPGHEQYTRNMATGASLSELALILVDATKGVSVQTLRHSVIVHLLGIRKVVVVVNKLDLLDYQESSFLDICQAYRLQITHRADFPDLLFVPISALRGDNIVHKSIHMPWYSGLPLLSLLESLPLALTASADFRLPIQYVLRSSHRRGYCGQVYSGSLTVGTEVTVLPAVKKAVVTELYAAGEVVNSLSAGMAGTVFIDRDLDISRGDLLITADQEVSELGDCFDAMIVWLDEEPLKLHCTYGFKGIAKNNAYIDHIYYRLDIVSGQKIPTQELCLNEIGLCRINLSEQILIEPVSTCPAMARFIFIDKINHFTCAAGLIQARRANCYVKWHEQSLTKAHRSRLKGHRPLVFWLTGLSGSGKSTIANALEERLYELGLHSYLLDGDNIRHGLNKDLGFSVADRAENIRRVAEVAKLFTEAGLVVIVSFISPFAADREKARQLFAADEFIEVFVDAPLAVCQKRDPKGFYQKAKQGLIAEFTGISAPYEKPICPEVHVQTAVQNVSECVQAILQAYY